MLGGGPDLLADYVTSSVQQSILGLLIADLNTA
jgi:hypothetical protein